MRFFQNIMVSINRFMYGRYGYDKLSRFLTIVALVLMILSPLSFALYLLSVFIFGFTIFRSFSKNIAKRRAELEKYYTVSNKIKSYFRLKKQIFNQRKTFKYYKCPVCRAYLKVPKGKGKIEISCPKCKNKIVKKT